MVTEAAESYPGGVLDTKQMNRILRHKLRNVCAGVKMTVDRIAAQTASTHPQLATRCDLINAELAGLQEFSSRMDLLFDAPPAPRKMTLFEIVSGLREIFVKKLPFVRAEFAGPEENIIFERGSWISEALREILFNAGEAAGTDSGPVCFVWGRDSSGENFTFAVSGPGRVPGDIPLAPPKPFFTQKSRHDGLGLAIAFRMAGLLEAEFLTDNAAETGAVFKLVLPRREFSL
jgi:hypothetical protein